MHKIQVQANWSKRLYLKT